MRKKLSLLITAYKSIQDELWLSLIILMILSGCLSGIMYLSEHTQNPAFSWVDALIWPIIKYVEDPAEIVSPPITLLGQVIGTIVGYIGIAIVAVPAGLIGSGFVDAIAMDKRREELAGIRRRMKKAFRRQANKGLREYLNKQTDGGGENYQTLNFVPQRILVPKMQVRQGMDFKDIIDACREFPEFRLKNLADAHSDEDDAEDRFVVEHFPRNRVYGCCIPRKSKVTIICTTSCIEVGIGWFTYYLAKMGGFNYISKEVTVDPDEADSFFNLSEKPLYDKKPLSEYDKKKDKEAVEILNRKQAHRDDFLGDLRSTVSDGSWVIIVAEHLKTKENRTDFHFAYTKEGGKDATVNDMAVYEALFNQFEAAMMEDFGLTSTISSSRYPLVKKNLGYKIRKDYPNTNVFVLRPSSELMNFNDRKLAIAYRMAAVISELLDGSRGMQPDDVKDIKETGFGYKENIEDGTA